MIHDSNTNSKGQRLVGPLGDDAGISLGRTMELRAFMDLNLIYSKLPKAGNID